MWASGLRAAETKTVLVPAYEFPEPLPALLTTAQAEGLATERIDVLPLRRPAIAGDAVTFLISLRRGKELHQWVLGMVAADLNDKELRLPALKEFHAFSSTGTELIFPGRRTAIELRLVGPQRAGAPAGELPKLQSHRLLVNADYLEFGFDAACEALIRRREEAAGQAAGPKLDYQMGSKPFPAATMQANRVIAARVGLDADRERAVVGATLALPEFLNLILHTPGLQDIVREVVDVSWWSVLSGGKTKPKLRFLSPLITRAQSANAGEGGSKFTLPFGVEIGGKPAMVCVLLVVAPEAPLTVTGGVIALQAGRPFDREPQLTVRAIATRLGSTGDSERKPVGPPEAVAK